MNERKVKRLTAIIAVTVAVASCGAGPDSNQTTQDPPRTIAPVLTEVTETAESIAPQPETWAAPECPHDPLTSFRVPVWYVLDVPTSWAEYDAADVQHSVETALALVDSGESAPLAADDEFLGIIELPGLVPSSQLLGEAPRSTMMRVPDALILADALDSLATEAVLVGYSDSGIPAVDEVGDHATVVVAMSAGGNAYLAQECGGVGQADLDAFASHQAQQRGTSGTDLVRLLARQDAAIELALDNWLTGAEPTPWVELPPDQRILDPEATPPEVLAELQLVHVEFMVPESWRGASEVLCTFTDLGWNECVSLSAGGTLEVGAYVPKGAGLDVYLLAPDANLATPLAHLGHIEARTVEAWSEEGPIRFLVENRSIEEAIESGTR